MGWYGRILIGTRIVLLLVAFFASLRPTSIGVSAVVIFFSTYIHPLISHWRSRPSPREDSSDDEGYRNIVTYEDLRQEWKNSRRRDDKASVRKVKKWFSDRGQEVLQRFLNIKESTQCRFAKNATLWAAPRDDNDEDSSYADDLETYVKRQVVDSFSVFSVLSEDENLDGFVIELPKRHSQDLESFSRAVYRVLKALADLSPTAFHCMDNNDAIGRTGWVFTFDTATYFVTTFAPFYPSTNCRFAFGADTGYLLFQPEISFTKHAISIPSEEPGSGDVRQQIRDAFREAGRPYVVIDPRASVAAHTVFSPDTGTTVEWWKSVSSETVSPRDVSDDR